MHLNTDILAKLTPEFIQRYNKPGPRYTSYPTIPNWKNGYFKEELSKYLILAGTHKREFSLYIHLPFCQRLCTFCGCNQYITNNPKIVKDYMQSLHNELAWVANQLGGKRSLRQLHLGGGTPTYLSLAQLQSLWQSITENFDLTPDPELAIEIHPGVTEWAQLDWLASVGFKRLSLGVQDLNPEVQRAINRFQTAEQTWGILRKSRELGFQSINLDLVYGLPKQTNEHFAETLAAVIENRPERLAIYSFAYIPGRFRTHKRAIREEDLPSSTQKLQLYLQTIQAFSRAGYQMIGMDHYAVPEDELAKALINHSLHRNFMGYTTLKGLSQLGVGMSAISDFGDGYFQNEKNLSRYMEAWLHNRPVPVVHQELDKDDLLRREIIDSLMCHGYLKIMTIEERFGIDFSEYFMDVLDRLKPMVFEGLISYTKDELRVEPIGQIFIRNIVIIFDNYIDRNFTQYSKTI